MKTMLQATLLLLSTLLVLMACAAEDPPFIGDKSEQLEDPKPPQQTTSPIVNPAPKSPAWQYPRERKLAGYDVTVHAPQIVDWDDFSTFNALMVVEIHLTDRDILGNFAISGLTRVNLDERLVIITNPEVDGITFSGNDSESQSEQLLEQLQGAIQEDRLEFPIDLFLYSLAEGAVDLPSSEGFNETAPFIKVAWAPTLQLFVNGDPFRLAIEDSELELISNANWPVVVDHSTNQYYLLNKQTWLQSEMLKGPWKKATRLPAGFKKIDPEGAFSALRAAYPIPQNSGEPSTDLPEVFFTNQPAELIVIDGEPEFETIADADGLQFVSNTLSPLFVFEDKFYFLTSGRWFSSTDLITWNFTSDLPDSFSSIPADHGMAYVRASIAGTLESKLAILEAYLPIENVVEADKTLKVDEQFDGDPQFKAVTDAGISRAVNTPLNIIEYQNVYYLCYKGAWYQADSPIGPWTAAYRVPDAVYNIPASSPAYPVTHVTVASTTPSTVTYQYTQGYSSGVYLSYGMPVYGTGWYYPPYRGLFYYPLFVSYGHGNYYNPNSGRYTTRSVWQGPYGGYSYNQYSNANSGRYGFVETAWDGDEWASYGESYNPRTRTYSETERYYSDDTERFEMQRETYRGDKSMYTERKVDLDDGWSETTRQTSEGGSSVVERHRQEDGSIIKEGSVTAGDGRSAEISGVYEDGKSTTTITGSEGREGTMERTRDANGVSRESTFTNDSGESLNAKTQRDGRSTTTQLNNSKGAEAISRSDGNSRSTVAKDSNGDLYASRDGNVYKKDGDGWQSFDPDTSQWQRADSEGRKATATRTKDSVNSSWKSQAKSIDSYRTSSSQLQRDARSRQGGYNQFNRRQSSARRYSGSRQRAGSFRGRR